VIALDKTVPEETATPPPALADGLEISFPTGLVGCPDWRNFVFRLTPEHAPISALENLDDPAISLSVIDPFILRPDYAIDMSESDTQLIELEDAADAAVLAILVVKHEPTLVTANLVGPIVINSRTNLACQLVLDNPEYSVRQLVYSEAAE
jgi:flagellar assembly factor FliW